VNPRFVIGVFVDEPRGLHTGGLIAAPVFREVAAYALDQLGGDAREPAERPSADTGPQDGVPRGRVETRAAHAGGDEG